mgnify:CR=1 FL=1
MYEFEEHKAAIDEFLNSLEHGKEITERQIRDVRARLEWMKILYHQASYKVSSHEMGQ